MLPAQRDDAMARLGIFPELYRIRWQLTQPSTRLVQSNAPSSSTAYSLSENCCKRNVLPPACRV
eukprot:3054573-Pleurochrysis_carterae.AAC.1